MFTGLIQTLGRAHRIEEGNDHSLRLTVESSLQNYVLGESIAVDGACLTVVSFDESSFTADVSSETLTKTNLSQLKEKDSIHLERALCFGDALGGHLLSGHVDCVGTRSSIEEAGEYNKATFNAPAEFAPYLAKKGSVAIDGVSLTVNEVEGYSFSVMLVPHTIEHTHLTKRERDSVNLEADLIARYVLRQLELSATTA